MTTEEWRSLPESNIEASSLGRVRRANTGEILRQRPHRPDPRYAYLVVGSRKECGRKSALVHRLVCEAFHGPPPHKFEVDHIDMNKQNNRADNLRWVPKSMNLARRIIPKGELHTGAKLTGRMVRLIRSVRPYRGFDADMAELLGVTRETIRDVRSNKIWSHIKLWNE